MLSLQPRRVRSKSALTSRSLTAIRRLEVAAVAAICSGRAARSVVAELHPLARQLGSVAVGRLLDVVFDHSGEWVRL